MRNAARARTGQAEAKPHCSGAPVLANRSNQAADGRPAWRLDDVATSTAEPTRGDMLYIATGAAAAVAGSAASGRSSPRMTDASTLALSSTKWTSQRSRKAIVTIKVARQAGVRPPPHQEGNPGAGGRSARSFPIRRPTSRASRPAGMAGRLRRLHASRLHPARPPGPVRRLVLPVPRLGGTTPRAVSARDPRRATWKSRTTPS